MFDDNLTFIDGTVDYNAANDTAPSSLTRDAATGAAVLDIGETGKNGLVAVLIVPNDVNGATDTLTAKLEACDAVGFGSAVQELGKFGVANATTGIILGSEVPCVAMLKFATNLRYVRINGTVGATPDDFGAVKAYLVSDAYKVL